MRSSLPWAFSLLLLACHRTAPVTSPVAPEVEPTGDPSTSGFSPFLPDEALSKVSPAAPTSTAAAASAPPISRPSSPSAVPPRPVAETTPRPAVPAKPAPSLKELGFRYETGHRGPGPHTGGFGLTMKGEMDPHLIQRIIRQNFGRFRLCYENGLRTDPNLQGRVTLRITIASDGSVSRSVDGGSDLPDPAVVACMISSARNLSFPQPTRGPVEFFYPIAFAPGV